MKLRKNVHYFLVSGGHAANRRTVTLGPAPTPSAPEETVLFAVPEIPAEETVVLPVVDATPDAPTEETVILPAVDTVPDAPTEETVILPVVDTVPDAPAEETALIPSLDDISGADEQTRLLPRLTQKVKETFGKKRSAESATRSFAPVKPNISHEHLYKGGSGESIFEKRRKPRSMAISVFFNVLKLLAVFVLAVGFAALGAVTGIAKAYIDTSPELDIGLLSDYDETSVIYDANGEVITTYAYLENREWADIESIPDMLINAFVAIEDVRFFNHGGVDFKRLASAILNTLRNKDTHGGSTITQQLIKNTILTSEQSYQRKIQEAFLALQLEGEYEKEEILEAYLNAIPLGGINYGVLAAAKDYFGKSLDQLTIRECAMLAGITQNPTMYNPRSNMYNENRDYQTTVDRTDTVLKAMYNAGFITKPQYEAALAENVTILRESAVSSMYPMASFVEYAISDVIGHMLEARGLENTSVNRSAMEKELRTGGYHIYTTVDPAVQNAVQQTLSEWEGYPSTADPTHAVTLSKNSDGTIDEVQQPQACAVVIEQSTGRIAALVGGRDEPTRQKVLNRAVSSSTLVGSSMKPIAVYAPALEGGASPGTILLNFAQPIEGWNSERGYPTGGLSSQGPVTMRYSVRKSLNVGAARTLYELVGVENSAQYLEAMGLDMDSVFVDGAGLALGASGVSMLDLTGAYATLANGGIYREPISFTKVVDSEGNVVLDAEKLQQQRKVFSKSTAWLMTDMLETAVESGTGTEAQIEGITAAGKTGTNDSYRGVVFAGYTGYYTSAVWIGHDDYHPLKSDSTGGAYAAPLWSAYMTKLHEGLEDKPILDAQPRDLGLVQATVCSVTGKLATEACQNDKEHKPVTEWFFAASLPTQNCDAHVTVQTCPETGLIAGENCPLKGRGKKTMLIIPQDSPLGAIDPELLQEHMPDAILGFANADQLTKAEEGSPAHEQYHCLLHSITLLPPTPDQLSAAYAVISYTNTLLNNNSFGMPAELRTRISAKLLNLQNTLGEGTDGALIEQLTFELSDLCAQAQNDYYTPVDGYTGGLPEYPEYEDELLPDDESEGVVG